jgi:hypothetical protein
MAFPFLSLLEPINTIIKNVFPDPQQQAQAQLAVMEKISSLDMSQIQLNNEEVKSDSIFKSGWRPALGWICVFGFAYTYILGPFADFFLVLNNLPPLPTLNSKELNSMLGGMLGLGLLRTVEKVKKVMK